MEISVNEKSKSLKDSASLIEAAIHEIIMILTSTRINSAEQQQGEI